MNRGELLRSYLQSLGLDGREVDFGFLADLVSRHVATFAFSSVGCHLGDELPLDVDSLYDRIVVRRRGGYCFEQNGLLFGILHELGLGPELYLARVIFNKSINPGLTHRISMIDYGGQRYLLDVGFGSSGPRIPIALSGAEAFDGLRTFRLRECRPGEYHLQYLKDGEFFSLYRFELASYFQSDCEVGHFYSHRHPDAAFVNHLVASLIREQEVCSLRDREYRVITNSGESLEEIRDSGHLLRLLVEELGIQVSAKECEGLFANLMTEKPLAPNRFE